jgi:hypothetical protein
VPSSLAAVDLSMAEAYFAPLGAAELAFEDRAIANA